MLQVFIVTAAHVIYHNGQTLESLRAVTHNHDVYHCTVARSWYKLHEKGHILPESDIAVLHCHHAITGARLEGALRSVALVPAGQPARLWEPLAFAGFIAAAFSDTATRVVEVEPNRTWLGAFVLRRTYATIHSSGAHDVSVGMMAVDLWSDTFTVSTTTATAEHAYAMLESAVPPGCSGGPILGKRCEAYGLAHGHGYGGIYTTLANLQAAVAAGKLIGRA